MKKFIFEGLIAICQLMIQLNFSPFPEIETERLLLRNLRNTDREEVFAIRRDEETMQYIPRPLAKTLEDADGVINMIVGFTERDERINWAITEKGKDKLIGIVGYVNFNKNNFRGELGYVLNKDYWDRGITFEALKATIEYGFGTIRLHSIEAIIRPDNTASKKLVEKAGFVKEAYFRDYVYHNNRFWDEEVYSLINSES